jgi:antitoxin (DNA-binding transcriptional repressor) of toxin-antitoxin stability system
MSSARFFENWQVDAFGQLFDPSANRRLFSHVNSLSTQSGKSDILIIRFMKKTSITVTEASRNFADCVNRAHYQNVTFVLLKNGEPVARLVPDNERVCVGRDLAEALAKNDLPENEARAWHRDLVAARKSLKAPADKWR